MRPARDWLAVADFDAMSEDLFQSFVARVGYDKATEVRETLRRIAENTLDSLGDLKLSERSMTRLMQMVASVAVDNSLGSYRDGDDAG